MSLSIVITKKSVKRTMPKLFSITLNLAVTDTAGPGIDKDFDIEYHTGDSIANKTAKAIEAMQAEIDIYKSERAIYDNAALNTAVDTIEGGLSA